MTDPPDPMKAEPQDLWSACEMIRHLRRLRDPRADQRAEALARTWLAPPFAPDAVRVPDFIQGIRLRRQ